MKNAVFIKNKLKNLKKEISNNKVNTNKLVKNLKMKLIQKFKIKIDYLEVRNTINLSSNIKNNDFKIFIAYYINDIRLIDNF